LKVLNTVLVSVVMGFSPSSGFELWAHPVRLARGNGYMTGLMVRRNINAAPRYHEFVI
jgi:hypothetical protein